MTRPQTKTFYSDAFSKFCTPLAAQVRADAYKDDIGQHSWTSSKEIDTIISKTGLSDGKFLLDAGCGSGGPLLYAVEKSGCAAHGIDFTPSAFAFGESSAIEKGLSGNIKFSQHDLRDTLPFADGIFDAIMSIDAVVHLPNAKSFFDEAYRVLKPKGAFVFTDAGIITGEVQVEQLALRASYGATRYVIAGHNEKLLKSSGFHAIETIDTSAQVLNNAQGRFQARLRYEQALKAEEGEAVFQKQQDYLTALIALSKNGALSRHLLVARRKWS